MTSKFLCWSKKAVIYGFFVFQILPTNLYAHGGSHGDTKGGVPTLGSTDHLPKGVKMSIVKTNAEQFVLATDGQQTVEVLDENLKPFIRINQGKVQANLASQAWHRAQMPGGGLVPDAIKNKAMAAKWVDVANQDGYGWYDKRLIDEQNTHFSVALKINGKITKLDVIRQAPEPLKGYWKAQVTEEPQWPWLSTILAGKSGQAVMLSLNKSTKHEIEILDHQEKPFLRIGPDGTFVNNTHPWFELINVKASTGQGWVRVNESSRVHYTDPRLMDWKNANDESTIHRSILFRDTSNGESQALKVAIQYQRFNTK